MFNLTHFCLGLKTVGWQNTIKLSVGLVRDLISLASSEFYLGSQKSHSAFKSMNLLVLKAEICCCCDFPISGSFPLFVPTDTEHKTCSKCHEICALSMILGTKFSLSQYICHTGHKVYEWAMAERIPLLNTHTHTQTGRRTRRELLRSKAD